MKRLALVTSLSLPALAACGSADAPALDGTSDGTEEGDPGELCDIPDPVLAALLRAELGLDAGAPIPVSRALELDDIGFAAEVTGMVSLEGLSCARNVGGIYFDGASVEDVAELAELPVLDIVHLDGSNLRDLSPLAGSASLFTLKVADNQLTSTSSIHDLPNLANLDLSGNPFDGLEGLEGLGGVRSFRIERTGVSDLSALSKFPQLNFFTAASAAVKSVESIPSHPSLEIVDLSGNQITQLDGFVGTSLPQLVSLDISGNPLTSLAGLEALVSLTSLTMNDTGLADLSPLANLGTPLTVITARGNGITDLSPVAAARHLDLSDNAISDLSPLVAAQSVGTLYLSNNAITDGSPLLGIDFEVCARVRFDGNPMQNQASIEEALCAADIEVEGVCLPLACDPCPGDGDCG